MDNTASASGVDFSAGITMISNNDSVSVTALYPGDIDDDGDGYTENDGDCDDADADGESGCHGGL